MSKKKFGQISDAERKELEEKAIMNMHSDRLETTE